MILITAVAPGLQTVLAESESSLKTLEVPRHPPANSTLFGAQVLTSGEILKKLKSYADSILALERLLDGVNSTAQFISHCEPEVSQPHTYGWIYINPNPLMTSKDEKLFSLLVRYTSLSSPNVTLMFPFSQGVILPSEVVKRSKNALPLDEIAVRFQDMIVAIRSGDLFRYELDYMMLTAYYISLKSWGLGGQYVHLGRADIALR
jgi:hypothetical protein